MNHRLRCAVLLIIPLLLASCPDNNDDPGGNFWALDTRTNHYYRLTAEKLAENDRCTVWADINSGVSVNDAEVVAVIYRQFIFNYIENFFGGGFLSYADNLGDGDGKLCILLLDIRDNYKEDVNESYVGGYFNPADLFSNDYYSNKRDMIYIDIFPQVINSLYFYRTLAHEIQHLMNFSASIKHRGSFMDTWIDEGLSTAAEWLITEKLKPLMDIPPSDSRLNWYNKNGNGGSMKGEIDKGNNFFVWGNRDNNPYAVLDDYATAYLFFQWLRIQSDGTDESSPIYTDILSSAVSDFKAVTNAANKHMAGNNYDNWQVLLKTWLAANSINDTSGKYGYLDEPDFRNVKAPLAGAGVTSINLYPGEGVYSFSASNIPVPANSGNIRYSGLHGKNIAPSDINVTAGGTLLTYNVNTNSGSGAEQGLITGNAALSEIAAFGFAIEKNAKTEPYQIGINDMLRINGFE